MKSHTFFYINEITDLFLNVICGEHGKVRALLDRDNGLLFERMRVEDLSGRVFSSISAFEYVLWAQDKHMWEAMIRCISLNEKNRVYIFKLMEQYTKVQTKGITYTLNGTEVTECHFSFKETIIKELKTLVGLMDSKTSNRDVIDKQWREGVGGAQRLLPQYVVDEYCSKYAFKNFMSRPLSCQQNYDCVDVRVRDWFTNEDLGAKYAIVQGMQAQEGGYSRVFSLERAPDSSDSMKVDLSAMKRLSQVRTVEFYQLESQLLNMKSHVDYRMKVSSTTPCPIKFY